METRQILRIRLTGSGCCVHGEPGPSLGAKMPDIGIWGGSLQLVATAPSSQGPTSRQLRDEAFVTHHNKAAEMRRRCPAGENHG